MTDNTEEVVPHLEALDLSKCPNPLARNIRVFKSKDWGNLKVDIDERVRVFTEPAAVKHYVMKLSPKAKELFLWLIYAVDGNARVTDTVDISFKEVSSAYSVSENTYKAAVVELMDARVIAMREPDIKSVKKGPLAVEGSFWINPQVLFPGTRYSFYRGQFEDMGEMKYIYPDFPPEQPAIPASQQSVMFPPSKWPPGYKEPLKPKPAKKSHPSAKSKSKRRRGPEK